VNDPVTCATYAVYTYTHVLRSLCARVYESTVTFGQRLANDEAPHRGKSLMAALVVHFTTTSVSWLNLGHV
jgi:hypothetical protein